MKHSIHRPGKEFPRFFFTTTSLLFLTVAHSFVPCFLAPVSRKFTFEHRVSDKEGSEIGAGEIIPDFGEADLQVAGVMIEDLSWRIERLRLEEQNRQRFLKARPRFLPYEECRKWVQAFNRWSSEKEWKSWIAMGEKRNSYIPSRPDEYYTYTGDWISWDHFLGVLSDTSASDDSDNISTE